MKDLLLRNIDLQRFSEDEGTDGASENQENTQEENNENEEIVSYSEDELQDAIKKAVKEATKGMLTKDKVNEIVKAEKAKEAERAKMSAEEIAEAERKETQNKLAEAQEEIRLMKLEKDTSQMLEENEVSQKFLEFLMKDDLETTKTNIEKFKKTYDEDLKNAVKQALKTKDPRANQETEPRSPWDIAAEKIR